MKIIEIIIEPKTGLRSNEKLRKGVNLIELASDPKRDSSAKIEE